MNNSMKEFNGLEEGMFSPIYGKRYPLGTKKKLGLPFLKRGEEDDKVDGYYFGHIDGKHYFLEVNEGRMIRVFTAEVNKDLMCKITEYQQGDKKEKSVNAVFYGTITNSALSEFVRKRVSEGLPSAWK